MAEIHITAFRHIGNGPDIPSIHRARLGTMQWPGGAAVPVLWMRIGDCDLRVWPADEEAIRDLGRQLIEVADSLAGTRAAAPRTDART